MLKSFFHKCLYKNVMLYQNARKLNNLLDPTIVSNLVILVMPPLIVKTEYAKH